MTSKNSRKEAPLESPKEGTEEYSLTIVEMQALRGGCDILKDFVHTSLPTLKKLNYNFRTLRDKLDLLNDDENTLRVREFDLSGPAADDMDSSELIKKRKELNAEWEKYWKARHKVHLLTIDISEFPKDREKFGKKTMYVNNQPREVDYVEGYLALLDYVIV